MLLMKGKSGGGGDNAPLICAFNQTINMEKNQHTFTSVWSSFSGDSAQSGRAT